MEYLNDYAKPEIIGYDAILTSLDKDNPKSDEYFFNTVKRIDNLVTGFSPLQQPYENEQEGRKYDIKFMNKFGVNIIKKYEPYDFGRYKSISEFQSHILML